MTSHQGETIHVLVLGDPCVGKTSLCRTLADGSLPTADILQGTSSPSKCPSYRCSPKTAIYANDNQYFLSLIDPPSGESAIKEILTSKDNRPSACYLCFDTSSPASFKRVTLKWRPLLDQHKFRGHVYLVGLKEDLAQDAGTRTRLASEGHEPVGDDVATNLANEIGALTFSKISSLKYLGVEDLKEKTVFNTLRPPSQDKQPASDRRRCVVM